MNWDDLIDKIIFKIVDKTIEFVFDLRISLWQKKIDIYQ